MSMNKRAYMLDTNIFNHVLDGHLDISQLADRARFFCTHIQLDEINRTSNPARKAALLHTFSSLSQEQVATESAVWGVSRWGQAKYTCRGNLYAPIRGRLDTLNKSKKSNLQDALIAETAIRNHFTLVTDGGDLYKVAAEFGGIVVTLVQMLCCDSDGIGGSP